MESHDEAQHIAALQPDIWISIVVQIKKAAVHRILIQIAIPEKVAKAKSYKV